MGEVGIHNEQILNDFGLVYVQAVCEIAFIDEPLPEERGYLSPYLCLPHHPTRNLCNLAKNAQQCRVGEGEEEGRVKGRLVKIYPLFAVFNWTTEQSQHTEACKRKGGGKPSLHKRNLFMQFRFISFRSGFICIVFCMYSYLFVNVFGFFFLSAAHCPFGCL